MSATRSESDSVSTVNNDPGVLSLSLSRSLDPTRNDGNPPPRHVSGNRDVWSLQTLPLSLSPPLAHIFADTAGNICHKIHITAQKCDSSWQDLLVLEHSSPHCKTEYFGDSGLKIDSLMIDFYCFENTHKTNRFDCDWGTRQKRYKNKNIIIITSKKSRVDHDDDD